MAKKGKRGIRICMLVLMFLSIQIIARADGVGETGGTGQGWIGGSNVYTFSYLYEPSIDAIVLRVDTRRPIHSFGNTTTHTYLSPNDNIVLNVTNPLLGNSLENAITSMNAAGGYNLSAIEVKAALNRLGYYDKGNGVWKYNGGYLTYVSANKIKPQIHTIQYDANGGSGAPASQTKTYGSMLNLSSKTPSRIGYTFEYWEASSGGNYNPRQAYGHDQDGGTVVMKAQWEDREGPTCSTFSATPTSWSAEDGTVTIQARDQGSGLASIVLERYSYVTRSRTTVKSWAYSGTTASVSEIYKETEEGVYSYRVTLRDKAGNTTVKTSDTIYLDHSNPMITGTNSTTTTWTNVAPVIRVKATDYLQGTTYNGSGVASVEIKDHTGKVVASGTDAASYTLTTKYEGAYTWTITATDYVGHTSTAQISTKYDVTKPFVTGTETTFVAPNGETVSGYCQDNIIHQSIDDKVEHSVNHPNLTSGLKSVLLYRVKDGIKTIVDTPETKATFGSPDTNTQFALYYDINLTEAYEEYYQIRVEDFAGNITIKKLTSQRTLLTWFRTSIDRSSYE